MMTWLERYATDASLRAFVDAETGRGLVELQALKVELAHVQHLLTVTKRELAEVKQAAGSKKSAVRKSAG